MNFIAKSQRVVVPAIKPLLGSLIAVAVTTGVLLIVDAELKPRQIILAYLLPVTLVAIQYGSMVAFFAAAISGGAAAYFFLPPKYSFYIDDPLHAAELGLFMLLAVLAAKVTALLMHDRRR